MQDFIGDADLQLQVVIDQAFKGNLQSDQFLLNHACERLKKLNKRMFHGFPQPLHSGQTGVECQNAITKLRRVLSGEPIESTRHFFNFAAAKIRIELLDLAKRSHLSQKSENKTHAEQRPLGSIACLTNVPPGTQENLERWLLFHYLVENLAADQQEIFNFVVYGGLPYQTAAKLSGVRTRIVKRRWQLAKIMIGQEIQNAGR